MFDVQTEMFSIQQIQRLKDLPKAFWSLVLKVPGRNYALVDLYVFLEAHFSSLGVWTIEEGDKLVGATVVQAPNGLDHQAFVLLAISSAPTAINRKVFRAVCAWAKAQNAKKLSMISKRNTKAWERAWHFKPAGTFLVLDLEERTSDG